MPSFIRFIALALALVGAAYSAPVANEYCPVEPSELSLERHQTTYRGAVVSFCCADCVTEFETNPERYLGELSEIAFDPPGRSPFQKRIDRVWNLGVAFPGITFAIIAGIVLLCLRRFAGGRRFAGRRAFAIVLGIALAGEAIAARLAHQRDRVELAESELENDIHYTVYQEYGDPPMPARPDRAPAVEAVYYRGNDERNPALFNGGHYRTTTFHLDLCDARGAAVGHSSAATVDDLFLRVRLDRAPGTPEYFWKPDRMAKIYATRDPGKFHGRHTALTDAVPMVETAPLESWEFRYPLRDFAKAEPARFVRGIIYLCEKRFDDGERLVGGRFHYAFQFDLALEAGTLSPESDLWMGALYRKRSLRIWEIPESQWLSTQPIPLIEGDQTTTDAKLLGIEAHEKDTN